MLFFPLRTGCNPPVSVKEKVSAVQKVTHTSLLAPLRSRECDTAGDNHMLSKCSSKPQSLVYPTIRCHQIHLTTAEGRLSCAHKQNKKNTAKLVFNTYIYIYILFWKFLLNLVCVFLCVCLWETGLCFQQQPRPDTEGQLVILYLHTVKILLPVDN